MRLGFVEAIHISAGTGEPLQALDSVKATTGVASRGIATRSAEAIIRTTCASAGT